MLIAHGEGIGQCIIKRHVLARVVAHCDRHVRVLLVARALRLNPVVVAAAVPCIHLAVSRMRNGTHPGNTRVLDIQPPWSIGLSRSVPLQKNRGAVGLPQRPRIVEAAHPLQSSKDVIEGAILLHQDDDVLRIQVGRAGIRSNGIGLLYRIGKHS